MQIDRKFYDAIIDFDRSDEAREYFYKAMDSEVDSDSGKVTLRVRILKAYSMLFCDILGVGAGHLATPEEVEATADRLHTGNMGFDPAHWYRMRHHFPVIDEDNYDRFAALVIADLRCGPLHDAAVSGGDMLIVSEIDPFNSTAEERRNQKVHVVNTDMIM